jgi:hypothetical protein
MIVLPEHILKLMTSADRKRYGAGALTAAEAIEKAKAGEEAKLQSEVRQYLNLHNIEFINPSMKRRSALPLGWPDFTFVYRSVPIVVECKTDVGRLSKEQKEMRLKLANNGWTYVLAKSLADVQTVFRIIDEARNKRSPWPIINP